MATPRNDVVRLRLTSMEKQAWAEAAGGQGKMSDWIRAKCNEAAFHLPQSPMPPRQSPPPGSTEVVVPKASPPPVASSASCPRERHHRSGVYCGACSSVIK